jgi:ribosome-associated protein
MTKISAVATKPAATEDDGLYMEDVLRIVRDAIDSKKGEQIQILDLRELVDYLDYIVLACGTTEIHNRALADAVMSELASRDILNDDLQGYRKGDWILIDYGVLVVHIFLPTLREFYRLDELWSGGEEIKFE